MSRIHKMIKDHYPQIIGQERAKGKLNFFLERYEETKILFPVFFGGSKGFGKTFFARSTAKNLLGEDGRPKRYFEMNGAAMRSLRGFVEGFIIPHLPGEITMFVDEIHSVDASILEWFLSALNPDENGIAIARYDNIEYTFDFRRFSFLSASTNPEAVSAALMSRFRRVELEPYSDAELTQILRNKAPHITFTNESERAIVEVSRGTPREISEHLAEDISFYCHINNLKIFNIKEWVSFRKRLSIRPKGLNSNEIEILKALDGGPQTLRALGAKLGLDAVTIQRDYELFLVKNGYIAIDGKRKITPSGKELLLECLKG